jgi:hypothetical protein
MVKSFLFIKPLHFAVLAVFFLISCEERSEVMTEELPVTKLKEASVSPGYPSDYTNIVAGDRVYVFPNPFSGTVTMFCNPVPEKIVISDSEGKLKTFDTEENFTLFDFSDAKNGIYLLQITFSDRIVEQQLFKSDQ